jgi:hypothetical protein
MSAQPPSCTVIGDPDLYGLGVRLTVYAQALVYLCATTYSKSPRMILEIPCVLLNVSISSILILRALQRRLRPFDTMLTLFTAGTLSLVAPLEEDALWEMRARTIAGSIITWLQMSCNNVQLVFGTWAVFNDLKVDTASEAEDCPVWIYLFSKQRNSGWALNFWKAAYCIFMPIFILRSLWSLRLVRYGVRMLSLWVSYLWSYAFGSKSNATPAKTVSKVVELPTVPPLTRPPIARLPPGPQADQLKIAPGSGQVGNLDKSSAGQSPEKRIRSRPETSALFASMFWFIFFNVLGGELMIYWNHVKGVNSLDSSGQLLSLIGGTFTLAQFIWAVSGLSLYSGG